MPRKPPAAPPAPPAPTTVPATVLPPADHGLTTGNAIGDDDRGAESDALAAYANLGGTTKNGVSVWRVNDAGPASYLFTVDPVDVPPEALFKRLRRDYGPGEYKIQPRREGRMMPPTTVTLEDEPHRGPAAAAAPAQLAGQAPGMDMSQFLLQQMNQAQDRTDKILAAVLGRPPAAGMDWAKVLTALVPIATPMIGGLLDMLKAAKPDPLEIVKKVAEIRELIGGGEGGVSERNVFDVLTEGLKNLGPLLQASAAPAPTMPAAARPAIAAPGAAVPPRQPPAMNQQNTPADHPLRVLLRMLVHAAARGGDPGSYANVIQDQWPGSEEQLAALLANPGWLEVLARFEPDVKGYSAWFEEIRTLLTTEPEEEPEVTEEPGSTG